MAGIAGATRYFGLSTEEWTLIFAAIGALVAVAGYFTSLYYKHQHLQLAREKAMAWNPLGDGE